MSAFGAMISAMSETSKTNAESFREAAAEAGAVESEHVADAVHAVGSPSPAARKVQGQDVSNWRNWARAIKRDVVALWIAARDARVPWYTKAVAAAVAAYALSPIDLIPDFIPVLGYLDDLIIVPLDIMLAVRLIPSDLMFEFRAEATTRLKPVSMAGLGFVIAVWIAVAMALIWGVSLKML